MSINEMESKARELRQLQSLIEEATAEAEVLKDAIKAAMGDAEEVRAGEYRITWKQVTSSRLDTAALKKCLPEVAERFTKQTTIGHVFLFGFRSRWSLHPLVFQCLEQVNCPSAKVFAANENTCTSH